MNYKKTYKDEFDMVKQLFSAEPGKVCWVKHDYQCFVFKSEKVCLVFYPHQTSALNFHLRVRNQKSKDKTKAIELLKILNNNGIPMKHGQHKSGRFKNKWEI